MKIKVPGFSSEINFISCERLEAFLAKIEIPQLLPCEIVTEEICDKLNGLCSFGKCNRLRDFEGIDIGFDLLFEGIPLKGFVECKYTDANLGKFTILDYIIKAKLKKSPFSMLVTYSIQNCLKSAASWKSKYEISDYDNVVSEMQSKKRRIYKLLEISENETEKEKLEKIEKQLENKEIQLEKKKKKMEVIEEKEKLIEGISIYSIYFQEYGMVSVPLVEYENPASIFVIIQTNFHVPKI